MSNTDDHNHAGTSERTCASCGISIEGHHPQALYCSARCRHRAKGRRRYQANPEKFRAKARRQYARSRPTRITETSRLTFSEWSKLLASALASFAPQPDHSK
jgi:hypothetical protein